MYGVHFRLLVFLTTRTLKENWTQEILKDEKEVRSIFFRGGAEGNYSLHLESVYDEIWNLKEETLCLDVHEDIGTGWKEINAVQNTGIKHSMGF